MGLVIENPEAAQLAQAVASAAGLSVSDAVVVALREKLDRDVPRGPVPTPEPTFDAAKFAALMKISEDCAALPDLDTRTPEEIIGYDELGVPQ
ncbi:MAG: type II toxin-antitoxin system VapB family antitoxin [Acidobacteria bacterium]|nr:type II toxin-antitoxin system VapB family antitoxin [Acidobacteriota bacterium]